MPAATQPHLYDEAILFVHVPLLLCSCTRRALFSFNDVWWSTVETSLLVTSGSFSTDSIVSYVDQPLPSARDGLLEHGPITSEHSRGGGSGRIGKTTPITYTEETIIPWLLARSECPRAPKGSNGPRPTRLSLLLCRPMSEYWKNAMSFTITTRKVLQ